MKVYSLLNDRALPTFLEVEVATSRRLPTFKIVGLPGREVSEAKERVRVSIEESGFRFPRKKVTVNLIPADERKSGTGLDLPIAISILSNEIHCGKKIFAWGELGLNGEIKSTRSLLRALYSAILAKADQVILPKADRESASQHITELVYSVKDISFPQINFAENLQEAMHLLLSKSDAQWTAPKINSQKKNSQPKVNLLSLPNDLSRVISIAAAGFHHILLFGVKGSGKTHALRWLHSLKPSASPSVLLEKKLIGELRSSISKEEENGFIWVNPTIKPSSLLGSFQSHSLRPGDFTLAHGGVLAADEFSEWSRDARESLRGPLETGEIILSRANTRQTLPAKFLFAGTSNLCPCGNRESFSKVPKNCAQSRVSCHQYLTRLSGPILDRIDILFETQRKGRLETRSQTEILNQVHHAHEKLIENWGKPPGWLDPSELEAIYSGSKFSNRRSLRSRHKEMRLALTIAALDGNEKPNENQIFEASLLRSSIEI